MSKANVLRGMSESFVIDRIKQYILTEQNLEELVKLTNEELAQTCDEERDRLDYWKELSCYRGLLLLL